MRNQFQVLLSNWSQVKEATELSAQAAGTADEKYEAYMDSIEAHLNMVTTAWEKFTQKLQQNESIKWILDAASILIERLGLITRMAATFASTNLFYKTKLGGGYSRDLLGRQKEGGASIKGTIQKGFNDVTQELKNVQSAIRGVQTTTMAQNGTNVFSVVGRNKKTINATYDETNGKWISVATGKEIKGQGNIAALNAERQRVSNQSRKKGFFHTPTKGDLAAGAFAGASSALTGMITGPTGSISGLFNGGWKVGDTSVNDIESDLTDRAITGAASGVLAGLGTAFLGPLGGMIGNILGDELGTLVKFFRHRDELERKQRVKEAKENLEALNGIKTATDGVESAINNLDTVEGVKAAKESIDKLVLELLKNSDTLKEVKEKLGIENISDIENVLLYGSEADKDTYLNTINKILNQQSIDEKLKSQEEERYQAEQNLSKTIKDNQKELKKQQKKEPEAAREIIDKVLNAVSDEDASRIAQNELKNLIQIEGVSEDTIKLFKKTASAYEKSVSTIVSLNRELWSGELQKAFYDSGLSLYSSIDVAGATVGEVVQLFADQLTLTGQSTRDINNMVTTEARTQIETFLRSNEKFASLFNTSTKTLNDTLAKNAEINKKLKDTGITYVQLRNTADQGKDALEDFANTLGMSTEELLKWTYAVDPSNMQQFANALNVSTDQLEELSNVVGNFSLAEVLYSPSEVRESFQDLSQMFQQLASTGHLTGENLEKLNSKYVTLYNQYGADHKITSVGSQNLLENIRNRLFGDANTVGSQAYLYQNSMFNELMGNQNFYNTIRELVESNKENLGLKDGDIEKVKAATTLSEIRPLIQSNDSLRNLLVETMNNMNMTNAYYEELQKALVDWQKHENETVINNLQSQIDALDNINKEREREISLIKAKDALENAKNEKKRVYRAGVGWTYETDQQAIESAQKELEELEREQDKDNLQYQIDLLQQQNTLLEDIDKNDELLALKNISKEYYDYMKDKYGETNSDLNNIIKLLDKDNTMKWNETLKRYEDNSLQQINNAYKELGEALGQASKADADLTGQKKSGGVHSSGYINAQESKISAANAVTDAIKTLTDLGVSTADIYTHMVSSTENASGGESYTNLAGTYLSSTAEKGISDKVTEGTEKEEEWYPVTGYIDMNNPLNSVSNTDLLTSWSSKGEYYAKINPNATNNSTKLIENLIQNPHRTALFYYDQNENKWKYPYANGMYTARNKFNSNREKVNSFIEGLQEGTVWAIANGVGSSKEIQYYRRGKGGDDVVTLISAETAANGTISTPHASPYLINELGTEGIVTPQGTLTALPAHTGVVPADLTKNLYKLGEVAPNLIKEMSFGQNLVGKDVYNNEDNSTNIHTLNATFNADSDFDFEQLLLQARQYLSTTKNHRT